MTSIKYYGQSCFEIVTKGKRLLTDPMLKYNPLAAGIDVSKIVADYILCSHGHADHVADLEEIANNNDATVISNYEIVEYFVGKGLNGKHMNTGGKIHCDFGTVKYVTAIHSSSLPDGTYAGNPGGFVVWNDELSFYFAGDTALTLDMKLIPMTCPKLDFAILPIGDCFTMGYEDALIAADFIECDTIVGCHYDTFPPIKIDKSAAQNAFKQAGKNLILLEPGQSMNI
ncbi:MAG TPA: metal-dependent hydrolase [Saprospiraceae bacterium]|nr:metal-dependent hydrolase [Saprospiraceae bacterium]HPQ20463.1 metal-dependent hydrolase [Saprospiraceae bacterium]